MIFTVILFMNIQSLRVLETCSSCDVNIRSAFSQGSLYDWVAEHRLHHAHFGTERDPFNPERGFWFAYLKNKILSSHPDYERLLKTVQVNDLQKDPVVMWQNR